MRSLLIIAAISTMGALLPASGATLAHFLDGSNNKDNHAAAVEHLETVGALDYARSLYGNYYSANNPFKRVPGSTGTNWIRIVPGEGLIANNTQGAIPSLTKDNAGIKAGLKASEGYELQMTSLTFDLMSLAAGSGATVDLSGSSIYYSVFYDLNDGMGYRSLDSAQNVKSTLVIADFSMSDIVTETVDLSGISGGQINFAISLGWSGPRPDQNRYGMAVSNIKLNGELAPVSIPEPVTGAFCLLGLSVLCLRRRK